MTKVFLYILGAIAVVSVCITLVSVIRDRKGSGDDVPDDRYPMW